MKTQIKFIIHDMHGCWSHHPHRTILAATRAIKDLCSNKTASQLIKQLTFEEGTLAQRMEVIANVLEVNPQLLIDRFMEHFEQIYIPSFGLKPTIKVLNRLGIKQVIVTNGPLDTVKDTVERWELDRYLLAIHGKSKGLEKIKPKKNLAEYVLEPLNLGIKASECLVVGDFEHDVEVAHKSGMQAALLVTTKKRLFYPNRNSKHQNFEIQLPDYVILNMTELIDIVIGNDLGWKERRSLLVSTGLKTGITKIW